MAKKNIDTRIFILHDVFPDFQAGLDEIIISRKIFKKLQENLKNAGIIFNGSEPLKIADIACGPADSIVKYLEKIDFSPGFNFRAIDYNEEYSGENGIAYRNLLSAKKSGKVPFKDIFVTQGDFNSNLKLNNLLFRNNENVQLNTFNIAFFLHAAYYVKLDETGTHMNNLDRILHDLACEVLRVDGVGIMNHTAVADYSTGYFIKKYGVKGASEPESKDYEMNIADPAISIASSCEEQNIPCYTLEYSSKLYFSSKFKEYAEIFKNPSRYNELLEFPEALKDYNKLSLLASRAPDEMAADKSETGLEAFIDELMNTVIEFDNKWCLPVFGKIQVILNPKSTQEWRSKIEDVIKKTESQIPEATIEGEEEYKNQV